MAYPVIYYETCAACGGQVRIEEQPDGLGHVAVSEVCIGCDNYFKFHLDKDGFIEAHAWTRERSTRA